MVNEKLLKHVIKAFEDLNVFANSCSGLVHDELVDAIMYCKMFLLENGCQVDNIDSKENFRAIVFYEGLINVADEIFCYDTFAPNDNLKLAWWSVSLAVHDFEFENPIVEKYVSKSRVKKNSV